MVWHLLSPEQLLEGSGIGFSNLTQHAARVLGQEPVAVSSENETIRPKTTRLDLDHGGYDRNWDAMLACRLDSLKSHIKTETPVWTPIPDHPWDWPCVPWEGFGGPT